MGLLDSKPKKIRQALELGFKYHEKGNFYKAEEEYIKALRIDPKNGEAHLKYGDLLKMTERPRAAEKEYRLAIECEPSLAEAHSALGEILHHKGHVDEAELEYRKAIQIKSHYVTPRINLGTLLTDRGRFTEARDIYKEALTYAKDPQLRQLLEQKLMA